MDKNKEKESIKNMENMRSNINFTDYAPLDQEYSKRELAEIYKKIITDIQTNTK